MFDDFRPDLGSIRLPPAPSKARYEVGASPRQELTVGKLAKISAASPCSEDLASRGGPLGGISDLD